MLTTSLMFFVVLKRSWPMPYSYQISNGRVNLRGRGFCPIPAHYRGIPDPVQNRVNAPYFGRGSFMSNSLKGICYLPFPPLRVHIVLFTARKADSCKMHLWMQSKRVQGSFYPERVAMSTTFCALLLFQLPWLMKVIPRVLPKIHVGNYGQFPSEQIVQTESELDSITLSLIKRQVEWKEKLTSCTKSLWEKILLGSNITTLSVPLGKLAGESSPASTVSSISSGQLQVCGVKVKQIVCEVSKKSEGEWVPLKVWYHICLWGLNSQTNKLMEKSQTFDRNFGHLHINAVTFLSRKQFKRP